MFLQHKGVFKLVIREYELYFQSLSKNCTNMKPIFFIGGKSGMHWCLKAKNPRSFLGGYQKGLGNFRVLFT